MTDAWASPTDYAQDARIHLDNASKASFTHGGHIQHQTEAQLGIGYALLALVDVLKPEETVLLEVGKTELPTDVSVWVDSEFERLRPFTGRGVRVMSSDGRQETNAYLTAVTRHDSFVICTVALQRSDDHVDVVSARVRPA
jgi:hypothetical protein